LPFRLVITGTEATVRTLRGADAIIALEVRDAVQDIMEQAEERAKELNPSTRTRITSQVSRERRFAGREVVNSFEGKLTASGPPHLEFIYRGTSPHIIRPKVGRQTASGRPAALWWEGAQHPSLEIHHPGTTANPFLDRAHRDINPYAKRRWNQVGSGVAFKMR
jgi:hypothetical protein